MEGFIIFLLVICALGIYFLPSIAGWNKRNADSIIAVNFFLGWTFIGWVVSLAWALIPDSEPHVVHQKIIEKPKEDKFDKIKKLKELLDNGAITGEEFQSEKARILRDTQDQKPN
jgi:hypothetical protein